MYERVCVVYGLKVINTLFNQSKVRFHSEKYKILDKIFILKFYFSHLHIHLPTILYDIKKKARR
jgi:hypothetical protein